MHFSRIALALSLASSTIALSGHFQRRQDTSTPPEKESTIVVDPKRFIVEFAKGVNAETAAAELAATRGTKVLKVYNSDVFSGAAFEAERENLDSFQAKDQVFQAWQSRRIALAPSVPSKSFSENATAYGYSIHEQTGVDKLHAAGIFGKGAIVAVIDTGIDYTHPALGGGFGSGFKIAGGFDLVGDGAWPDDTIGKVPDKDIMDNQGHGTHVAGTIAAKSDLFTGVAPESTILGYKVFSTLGYTDEETLIDAFLMAYEDGADIITASIGGVNGWSDNAWAVVASRLVDQGVLVTISAGNDGTVGPYAAGSGSSGKHVLAVASVNAEIIISSSFKGTFNLDGKSNTTNVAYRASYDWYPSEVAGWPIFPLNLDTSTLNEACNPLPAGTPDLSAVVVLIRRGGCNFSQKQQNVAAFGAKHLLVYNNEDPLVVPGQTDPTPLIGVLTAAAGASIIGTIKAGGNVTADFTARPIENLVGTPNELSGGRANYFTSIGATNELFIKPDIAAAGGQIFSTYLSGGYAVLDGTSMACPYVAGVAALYIGKHGGRKTHGPGIAKKLAMRIIASGESIPWDDALEEGNTYGDHLASVAQVGTGLINAVKVVNYDTSLSFAKFALNDTAYFSRYHTVDITNSGSTPVTYTFEAQDYAGFDSLLTDPAVWGTPRISWYEDIIFNPQKMVPRISFPSGTFTVQPGQTRKAEFTFNPPEGLDASRMPLYSGKVLIKGSNNETVGVPYMGLAASLKRDLGDLFHYAIGFPTLTSTTRGIPISQKANFTFDLSLAAQDFPQLYNRIQYASREVRWDIFDSSYGERHWVYPPVVGQGKFIGSVTSWAQAGYTGPFDPATDDKNDLITLPIRNVPRDVTGQYGMYLWWLGGLANGTQIAPGKYRMRFAALLPFGRPEASDNWEILETPEFEVLPLKK